MGKETFLNEAFSSLEVIRKNVTVNFSYRDDTIAVSFRLTVLMFCN